MKRLLLFLFIITFLLLVVFGPTLLHYGMSHIDGHCVVSFITGDTCPENEIGLFTHHTKALYLFFNVPVSLFFFSLTLFSLLFFLSTHNKRQIKEISQFLYSKRIEKRFFGLSLMRWFSLSIRSPSF